MKKYNYYTSKGNSSATADEQDSNNNNNSNGNQKYRQYFGGSGSQSSLLAALDIFFGVDHQVNNGMTGTSKQCPLRCAPIMKSDGGDSSKKRPEQQLPAPKHSDDDLNFKSEKNAIGSLEKISAEQPEKPLQKNRNNNSSSSSSYIRTMRMHMPGPHREFLHDLEQNANLRPFMLDILNEQQQQKRIFNDKAIYREDIDNRKKLLQTYNDCITQLSLFRNKHIQIVALYVINQARKKNNLSNSLDKSLVNKQCSFGEEQTTKVQQQEARHHSSYVNDGNNEVSSNYNKIPKTTRGIRGSGGTEIVPFLKHVRDNTNISKIDISSTTSDTSRVVQAIDTNNADAQVPNIGRKQEQSYFSWINSWFIVKKN